MKKSIKVPNSIWLKFGKGNCWITVKLLDGREIQDLFVNEDGEIIGRPLAETKDTVFSLDGLGPDDHIIGIRRNSGFLAKIGLRQWISL